MSTNFIKRYAGNPVLGPEPDCPWGSNEARNPGVVFDGKTFHMVFTATGGVRADAQIHLGYASSRDGFNFERRDEPIIAPSPNEGDFDWGDVEDTRITEIDGTYYIAYAGRAVTQNKGLGQGYIPKNIPNNHPTWTQVFRRVGLAATKDFKSVEKLGPITSEFLSDANVALFPEKINGKYVMLHRPTPFSAGNHGCFYCQGNMFIAFSDDLLNWFPNDANAINRTPDNDFLLIRPEQPWEVQKVGGAGVPIKTDDGWLMMYHAKDAANAYRCGLLLLDLEDPRKVIARTTKPIFEPESPFELDGNYKGGSVFPCSHIVVDDEVFIYYGASDEFIGVATVKLQQLLDVVLKERL
ncbi:MAG: hypothetical protein L3J71_11475 [Victivallaceae bacterium]|nr:hypothetical protein [Victivallaceae bacterium]